MAVLVIAEHDNRSLKPATLNSITAAAAFSVSVDVLVAGHQAAAVAQAAAAVPGVVNAREEGASTIVETDRPEDVLVTLGQRVGFDNIHTRATTLEDVYLRLTGKEYSA